MSATSVLEAAASIVASSRHGNFPASLLESAANVSLTSVQDITVFSLAFIQPDYPKNLLYASSICTALAAVKLIVSTVTLSIRWRQGKLGLLRPVRTKRGFLYVPYTFNAFFITNYASSLLAFIWLALLTASQIHSFQECGGLIAWVGALWLVIWWPLYACFLWGTVASAYTIGEAFDRPIPAIYDNLSSSMLATTTIGILMSPLPALVVCLTWAGEFGSSLQKNLSQRPVVLHASALAQADPDTIDATLIIDLLRRASALWDQSLVTQTVVRKSMLTWIILMLTAVAYWIPRMINNLCILRKALSQRRGVWTGLNDLLNNASELERASMGPSTEHGSEQTQSQTAPSKQPSSEETKSNPASHSSLLDTKAFSLLTKSAEGSPFSRDFVQLPEIEEEHLPFSADLHEVSSPRVIQAVQKQRVRAAASKMSSAMRDCLFMGLLLIAALYTASSVTVMAIKIVVVNVNIYANGPTQGKGLLDFSFLVSCIIITTQGAMTCAAFLLRLLDESSTDYLGTRRHDRDDGNASGSIMKKEYQSAHWRQRRLANGSEPLVIKIEQSVFVC